ncbi:MAG: amylo-alpha-1,6-glucosidase [Bacteroidales bacterium]
MTSKSFAIELTPPAIWKALLPLLSFCFMPIAPAVAQLAPARPVKVKVAVVIQDPVLPQYGGKRLHEVVKTPGRTFTWNDPYVLNSEYEAALGKISHGTVQYEVVRIIDDGHFFSRRNDNGKMLGTDEMVELLMEPEWKTLKQTGTHFDYQAFVEHYGFDRMRDRDQIHEVWVWSFPYGGMWESNYCGAGGFWLNSEPTTTTSNKKLLVVMGLNYERKMSLALESYGHRFESVMWHVYGRWDYQAGNPNNWEKYTRFNKTHPGLANIGNIHFPPNGMHDYDWTNRTPVTTCADGWAFYPDIREGLARTVDCTEWECTHEGYMTWWFSHLPHFEGVNPADGKLNNWWHYVVNWEEALKQEAKLEGRSKMQKQVGEGRVGLLVGGGDDDVEARALGEFLLKLDPAGFQPIAVSSAGRRGFGKEVDILWYHEADSTIDPGEIAGHLAGPLKEYVANGGKLVLSLEAVRLLPYLGVEEVEPAVSYVKLADAGYGRKLGLHAFRSHPVFEGMLGGAYVYAPKEDVLVRRVGWSGDLLPSGRVVAVDWAYIFLHEQTRLMTEYDYGKGKILAIGAYLHYEQPNFNRAHLERFTTNVLDYLLDRPAESPRRYWDFSLPRVAEEAMAINPGPMEAGRPVPWELPESGMTLSAKSSPKNMWDIAGERMVIMGKEPAGIDEIWAHPVMVLRDYQVTAGRAGDPQGIPLAGLTPEISVRPEAFVRTYAVFGGELREVTTVHPRDGIAVVHYEYSGTGPIDLNIRFKSNLRLMWPYSERVTGEILYQWDERLNAWIIRDKGGDFSVVVGANVPLQGRQARPDEGLLASFEMDIRLLPGGAADVVVGTSASGVPEAVSAYRRGTVNAAGVHTAAWDYASSLFNGKLSISGPDEEFNKGFQWALVGTDRFIVNTPGLGRSLVAGYATTAFGWNGAQKVNGRPGYAWYFGRDAVWSAFAMLGYGDFDRVRTILELFSRYQDISGKIYHELTTSGIAHYDAADATPLYIVLAGVYLHHTGDLDFIRKEWPAIKKAIDFCFTTDTDGDHLIENTQQGHGWEEGGSLYVTHTTQYMVSCWAEALSQGAYMAQHLELPEVAGHYAEEAGIVLDCLNDQFWNPDTGFFNHGKFKDGTYLDEPSVMTAIPLHWGQIRDPHKSASVAQQLASCHFTTDWGTRIVSDKASFFAPGGYHTGSVWPLFTGWASLGDFATGNLNQGFSKMMSNLLIYKHWSLGYVEEVLHGTEFKYFGVCRHQCWSETMVLQPAIDGMLGLKPDALNNEVSLSVNFPFDWDAVRVGNIRVGAHLFRLELTREPNRTDLVIKRIGDNPGGVDGAALKVGLYIPLLKGAEVSEMIVNGIEINQLNYVLWQCGINWVDELTDEVHIEVYHTGGVSVLPEVHHPRPGDASTGLKVISDRLEDGNYRVILEGMSGTEGQVRIIRPEGITLQRVAFPGSDEVYSRVDLTFPVEAKPAL